MYVLKDIINNSNPDSNLYFLLIMATITNNSSSGGIGFIGALTILFIALKLLDKIKWSWIWVLSPMWITTLIVLIIFLVVVIIAGIIEVVT